jgi:hypothetical protein
MCLARAGAAAEVDWRGPARCPDPDEVRFRIERAIGMPLSHAAPLRFDVRAQPVARGFMASIDVQASSGSRTRQRALVAADCGQLAEMVTVAVALALGAALDDSEQLEESRLDALQGADAAAPSESSSAAVRDADAAPAPRDGAEEIRPSEAAAAAWQPGVSFGLVADAGSLPKPGAGALAGLSIGRELVELRASGSWLFEQHTSVDTRAGTRAGADLSLFVGALSACFVPLGSSEASIAARGCAGWELGRLAGEGTGIERPRRAAELWNAPRLDAGASFALGSGSLRFDAGFTLAVPLERKNFILEDVGSVHRPSALVGRASFGIEWIPK